jgi:hypothetical protein
MAPQRTNENATPFGKWLDRHGLTYAQAARELGVTRERVRQMAQKHYPSLLLNFVIEDWTRSVDPDDVIAAQEWREVVLSSSEAKEALARVTRVVPPPPQTPAPAPRPRAKSRLRR